MTTSTGQNLFLKNLALISGADHSFECGLIIPQRNTPGSRRAPRAADQESADAYSPTLRDWSKSPPSKQKVPAAPAERSGRLRSRESSRLHSNAKLPSISKGKQPLQSSVAFHDEIYPTEPWKEVSVEVALF